MSRRLAGLTAIHVLLLVALLEVAINRVAVPLLRVPKGEPPTWFVVLDYAGLFLLNFTGALAVGVLAVRCYTVLRARFALRDHAEVSLPFAIAHGAVAIPMACAALILFMRPSEDLTQLIVATFALAVIALVVSLLPAGKGPLGERDLGAQVGIGVIAIPLLFHCGNVLGRKFLWPENIYDGLGPEIVRIGVLTLALAALATPYCFAPRPFARAVTRPLPVIIAMGIASIGAVLARTSYAKVVAGTKAAIGVELNPTQADPKLALYLLSIATLSWTLASCARAPSPARRTIGLGLAFVVLGGYQFEFAHHWLLPLLGMALIADGARHVREEELAAIPIKNETPPITDGTWSAYIATVCAGLRRSVDDVHSLTTRGDGGLASSVIVGDAHGLSIRTRIDRIEGCVLALDVVVGREVDELRGSTVTMWAHPPPKSGNNPAGPPASPVIKSGDPSFDERFKLRGSGAAFGQLFDDELRARTVATLDGWLAYWDEEGGLRYRVYPGRGAPLDHPIPLSDLALEKVPSAERLVAVIELLVAIARRVLEPATPAVDDEPAPPADDDEVN